MGSSAMRLPNGNTFIAESTTGRLFEVTPAHETVWEYVNPFSHGSKFGATPTVFRAFRIAADDPRLAGRDLSPGRFANLNEKIAAGPLALDEEE